MESIRLSSALRKNSVLRGRQVRLTAATAVAVIAVPLLSLGCSHAETSENTITAAPIDVPKAQAIQASQIQKIQNSDLPPDAKARAIAAIQANGKGQY